MMPCGPSAGALKSTVLHRQATNARTRSAENCVHESGRDRRHSGLANAAPSTAVVAAAWQQIHLDARSLVHPNERVVMEVALLRTAGVERHLAAERRRQPLDNGALNLSFADCGIHHVAGIDHAHDTPCLDRAVRRPSNLDHLRANRVMTLDESNALIDPAR